eukprot:TRINITY_DN41350_c0_g1_i1.p1 TRINITY_DN41350_c0_g1~~TRINITY_DN41350_c0_g1_i1.p1  ORF type:complete len:119 (-),score=0.85 TRINITY_DN41350_c0_g1_i1:19-375(-)
MIMTMIVIMVKVMVTHVVGSFEAFHTFFVWHLLRFSHNWRWHCRTKRCRPPCLSCPYLTRLGITYTDVVFCLTMYKLELYRLLFAALVGNARVQISLAPERDVVTFCETTERTIVADV